MPSTNDEHIEISHETAKLAVWALERMISERREWIYRGTEHAEHHRTEMRLEIKAVNELERGLKGE